MNPIAASNTFFKTRRNLVLNGLFFLCVASVIVTRIFIFLQYNLSVIDSDQPFMWIGASDYAKGLFYEPRYYGQGYNTFMEALFAVPLTWLKVPIYCAVPLATHFIALFPFLFMSFYLFIKQKKIHAILVLSVIICLPATYDLINSLPRGFVTGLFFTSFFILNILDPYNLKFVLLNIVLAVTGYFVNPNSAIVTAPVLFYLFLHHYKNPPFYAVGLFGALTALPLYFMFDRLYAIHPEYIINPLFYRFSTDFFWLNITNTDQLFAHISFFFENKSILLLLALLLFPVLLFRKDKKAFLSFIVFFTVVLFSFCFGKTLEGSTWAYMPFSRMYLGIPVVICLFIPLISLQLNRAVLLLMLPVLFSVYKITHLQKLLAPHHDGHNWVGVHLFPLKDALNAIDVYKEHCIKNNAPFLLVSNKFWMNTVIVYGGPALDDDFPNTQETQLEKRYWVRKENKNKVIKRFALISENYNLHKIIPQSNNFKLQPIDSYGLFLVTDNKMQMNDFIDVVNTFEYRTQ